MPCQTALLQQREESKPPHSQHVHGCFADFLRKELVAKSKANRLKEAPRRSAALYLLNSGNMRCSLICVLSYTPKPSKDDRAPLSRASSRGKACLRPTCNDQLRKGARLVQENMPGLFRRTSLLAPSYSVRIGVFPMPDEGSSDSTASHGVENRTRSSAIFGWILK